MSQPARQRKAAASTKAEKRRRDSDSDSDLSSTLDLSSDGGYSALDEVSEDDDDDNDVYAAEEEAIINDVTKPRHSRTPRPTNRKEDEIAIGDDSDGDDEGDDEDGGDDDDDDEIPVNEEEDYSSGPDANIEDSLSWNGILESDINNASEQSPERRHVRFAGVPDSDNESDSNSTPTVSSDEFFPDVFIEKQSLDEAFRRQIEEESDSSNSATFWDFTAPTNNAINDDILATDVANLVASEAAVSTALGKRTGEAEAESESDSNNGYETDGDTTEDDEPQLLPRRKPSFRSAQLAGEDSSDSDSESFVPVRNRRGQPRIGRFALSNKRSKPIAVINPITRKMVIFTPEAPREMEVATEPIPLNFNMGFYSLDGSDMIQSSPLQRHANPYLFSDPTQAVSNNDLIHSDPVGGGLGSYNDLGLGMGFNEDSDEISAEFGEDPGEHTLRIEDFICFDRNAEADVTQNTALDEALNTAFDPTDETDFDSFFDTTAIDATLASLPPEEVEAAINGLFGENPIVPDEPFFGTGLDMVDLSSSIMGGDENNDYDDGATPAETPRAATPGGAAGPSPAPADAKPDSPPLHPLMAHFNKNSDVGAFRRNQINHQLISSNKATAESLAFSGPLSMGTLRGIKHGSLSAVSAPLTPPRRPKRKANEDGPSTHKRYRSISEVKDLAL